MGFWLFGGRHPTLRESGFFSGFTDCHSHILSGVDDGARTIAESLEILAEYERLGVAAVWLTPHIMEEVPNTTAALRERFAELREAWGGTVELRLAAENMLDNLFDERLAAGDLLPLGAMNDHLLVETSFHSPPLDLTGTLERIRVAGYYPVLAHPERYMYMDEGDYRSLHGMGVKMQLNLVSLGGLYGGEVRRKARWLLSAGMYDCAGTDLHRKQWIENVCNARLDRDLRTKMNNLDKVSANGC